LSTRGSSVGIRLTLTRARLAAATNAEVSHDHRPRVRCGTGWNSASASIVPRVSR
jgi:hypothetical protein